MADRSKIMRRRGNGRRITCGLRADKRQRSAGTARHLAIDRRLRTADVAFLRRLDGRADRRRVRLAARVCRPGGAEPTARLGQPSGLARLLWRNVLNRLAEAIDDPGCCPPARPDGGVEHCALRHIHLPRRRPHIIWLLNRENCRRAHFLRVWSHLRRAIGRPHDGSARGGIDEHDRAQRSLLLLFPAAPRARHRRARQTAPLACCLCWRSCSFRLSRSGWHKSFPPPARLS